MAYFVVFLREKKKYVVLPVNWIKDIENHFEKFVNNSLNTSQLFLCFCPDTSSHAYTDGRPDFDSEYCFMGKLKRFYGKYIDRMHFFLLMGYIQN